MDTSGRKRKSRFSDAVQRSDAPTAPASAAAGGAQQIGAAVDAAALAKAAAEKIARAIPGGIGLTPVTTAPLAPTTRATGDVDEQIRLAEEKRRRTDQIYQSVQQQMSHIKALLGKPGVAPATANTFMPAPLLLDEHGRQIDATGKVIEEAIAAPVATLKANQDGSVARSSNSSKAPSKQNMNPYLSHRAVDKEDAVDAVDPRLSIKKRETYVSLYCCCLSELLMLLC